MPRETPHPAAGPLCDQEEESIQHLLLSSVFAQQVWFIIFQWLSLAALPSHHNLPPADSQVVKLVVQGNEGGLKRRSRKGLLPHYSSGMGNLEPSQRLYAAANRVHSPSFGVLVPAGPKCLQELLARASILHPLMCCCLLEQKASRSYFPAQDIPYFH